MDLLRKVRILIGALTHAPFAPRPEKDGDLPQGQGTVRGHTPLAEPKAEVAETERVADLIARQKG